MNRLAIACAAGAICAGATLHTRAEDTKPPAATRNILQQHDQSGVPGKEILLGTASFPAGGVVGFHTHPGDETGYVVKGKVVIKTQGQPDRPLQQGESFFNPRGAVHSVIAGPDGATVVASWIVDKGTPMATPVP